MCKRDGESVDHLLLHCDVSYALWSALFTCFGLSLVMPRRVFDLFACWWTSGRPRSTAIWKMVLTCILWCVWKERNNRCFEDLKRSLEDILASFFHTLYLWTMAFVSHLSLSFGDFLVHFLISSYVLSLVCFRCTYGRLSLLIKPVYYLSKIEREREREE
jgi:hypothetical protein